MSLSIDRFAELALACAQREYPNRLGHLLRGDSDARTPRELTPVFYGCFDWHSAVHGHWLLAVAAERAEDETIRERAIETLRVSLTERKIAAEVSYMEPRPAFERPYGLAWLVELHGELSRTSVVELQDLAPVLEPLVDVAVGHIASWLPKLSRPTRSGVHSQTAFALGLFIDWARAVGRGAEETLFTSRAGTFYGDDRDYAVHLEPDGEDFLSPALGAADLMARVLSPAEFEAWLERAIPALGRSHDTWLDPAVVTDPSDGRLAHLDGLNLSRAWMLERVARALPADDSRAESIRAAASLHAERGLASVSAARYEGSHWLGTFATYLTLQRV